MPRVSLRLLLCFAAAAASAAPSAPVPPAASAGFAAASIAPEVSRLQAFVATDPGTNADGKSIRDGSRPLLADAETALAAERPWLALSRLSIVWGNLEGSRYVEGLPAASRGSLPALESAWGAFGGARSTLAALDPPVSAAAAARAVAEGARLQAEGYHEASLEYGKNTVVDAGHFYIGAARGQLELARFAETLPVPEANGRPLPPPSVRRITVEIAALEKDLLAAYRPPASIDSHAVFIRASALLKEARELEAAGQHFGALHRLLDARHRLSRLVRGGALSAEAAALREREARERLRVAGHDPSLLLMFVEAAALDAAPSSPLPPEAKPGELARAVFDDVVPLYFAALGPAPPEPPQVKAQATVTLVRWPYT